MIPKKLAGEATFKFPVRTGAALLAAKNPEELFGTNAGKVWVTLNETKKGLSIDRIVSVTGLSSELAWGGLGWLGREGKLRIENSKFFLNE